MESNTLIIEPDFPLLHEIEEMVVYDFGIDDLMLITLLFSREVFLNRNLLDLIQVKTTSTDFLFTIWGVITRQKFYLLVGIEIEFFPEERRTDPFIESEDFDTFAMELRSHLGLANAKLYEGNELYNYSTLEEDSKTYSFFLYEV